MKILPLSIGVALISFAITACESPSSTGSASGDGRERLSINKSYAELGDYNQSICDFNRALEIDSNNVIAFKNRDRALKQRRCRFTRRRNSAAGRAGR